MWSCIHVNAALQFVPASPSSPCPQVRPYICVSIPSLQTGSEEITHRLPSQAWLPSCKHRNRLWLIWVKWRCIKGCWEICRIWARAPGPGGPSPARQEQHPDGFRTNWSGKAHGRHCRVLPLPRACCVTASARYSMSQESPPSF